MTATYDRNCNHAECVAARRPIADTPSDYWAEALHNYPAWRASIAGPRAAEYRETVAMIAPHRSTAPGEVRRLQAHGRYMARVMSSGYDPEED